MKRGLPPSAENCLSQGTRKAISSSSAGPGSPRSWPPAGHPLPHQGTLHLCGSIGVRKTTTRCQWAPEVLSVALQPPTGAPRWSLLKYRPQSTLSSRGGSWCHRPAATVALHIWPRWPMAGGPGRAQPQLPGRADRRRHFGSF